LLALFRGFAAAAALAVALAGCVEGAAATGSRFDPTGPMIHARISHTATLLSDGRVLVAGGDIGRPSRKGQVYAPPSPTAELYDPATGSFSSTAQMTIAHEGHTATLLSDGRVLLAGGAYAGRPIVTAELYDPATGMFRATGSMSVARLGHSATPLPDGRVLVAGGWDGAAFTATAELYDPKSGGFTATGSMSAPRAYHTATLLPDGRVLVAGGYGPADLDSAELYDPPRVHSRKPDHSARPASARRPLCSPTAASSSPEA
jgi:hypothetical protein